VSQRESKKQEKNKSFAGEKINMENFFVLPSAERSEAVAGTPVRAKPR